MAGQTLSVAALLIHDAQVMARYAIEKGLNIPPWTLPTLHEITAARSQTADRELTLNKEQLHAATKLHNALTELVAPATPASIRTTEPAIGIVNAIKHIPLMSAMTMVSILFLGLYLAAPFLSGKNALINDLFIFASAGLGASFFALFTANRYIINRTFDSSYSIIYWTRLFLGIIAGVVISKIIPIQFATDAKESTTFLSHLGPSAIAFLGGYASDAVNRILRRMVDMLTTMVRGDVDDVVASHRKQLRAEFEQKLKLQQLQTAVTVLDAYKNAGGDAATAQKQLEELVGKLILDEHLPGLSTPHLPVSSERPVN